MLLKEISCLDAACYGYAAAVLRVGWSSEWQHVGYGAYPRAECRQKIWAQVHDNLQCSHSLKRLCGHEYTFACAGEERKGNSRGVPRGEMLRKWAKQMTEKGCDCSLRIPEEVNITEENNVILAKNNIDIRRNGNILATGRFTLETTEDFQPSEGWGCEAAFQEEQASRRVITCWKVLSEGTGKGTVCFRSTAPAPCLSPFPERPLKLWTSLWI